MLPALFGEYAMPQLELTNATAINLGSIYCIGRNYVEHIAELNNERPDAPVVFDKPASALLRSGGTIHLPKESDDVHYESEIVVLLGSGGRNLSLAEAGKAIAAYGVGLDLTARDWQQKAKEKGLPWTLAKGFDGAACVSAFVPATECPPADDISFTMHLNGELRQQGNSSMMLFPIAEQIAYISRYITLNEGDIVYTGTPKGVGRLQSGDQIELNLLDKVHATFTVA